LFEKPSWVTKLFNQMDKQTIILKYLSVLGLKRVAWPPLPENFENTVTEQPVYGKVTGFSVTEGLCKIICGILTNLCIYYE
jgi:hypothetical protein